MVILLSATVMVAGMCYIVHVFQKLFEESKWSKTLFGYQYVAFQYMADASTADLQDVAERVPTYQLRIGLCPF